MKVLLQLLSLPKGEGRQMAHFFGTTDEIESLFNRRCADSKCRQWVPKASTDPLRLRVVYVSHDDDVYEVIAVWASQNFVDWDCLYN